MKSDFRIWFDSVYEFLVATSFPFGFVTGEVLDEDLLRLAKGRYTPEQLVRIKQIFKHYMDRLPLEDDFVEEKARVLE